jgi:hypothetical protein
VLCGQFADDFGISRAAVSTNKHLFQATEIVSFQIECEEAGGHYTSTFGGVMRIGTSKSGRFKDTQKTKIVPFFKCDAVGWKYLDGAASRPPSFPTDVLHVKGFEDAKITLPAGSESGEDLCRILRRAEAKRESALMGKYPEGIPAFDYENPPKFGDPDYDPTAAYYRGDGASQ